MLHGWGADVGYAQLLVVSWSMCACARTPGIMVLRAKGARKLVARELKALRERKELGHSKRIVVPASGW